MNMKQAARKGQSSRHSDQRQPRRSRSIEESVKAAHEGDKALPTAALATSKSETEP